MSRTFTDIESIIREGTSGRLDGDAFFAFCAANCLGFGEICNTIASTVAHRFNDSEMTFDDADGVMNAFSVLMIEYVTREENASLPEPAWEIFLAFDAGEYDHGDGADPVERFTRPLIRKLIEKL